MAQLQHRSNLCFIQSALSIIAVFSLTMAAFANSDMFKPIGSAATIIHINGRGFTINSKPVFICSGSFHYARVPRALWQNRLLKMKRAGFNTVQTYVFWNFQEPQPGVFAFKGRANLNAFLQLVHKLGMYALVRCGPYDCAEWDDGGYPLWLAMQPGVVVRRDDPAFMNPLRVFWNKLLPIVAANQINHGGAVILVQLENEDNAWGTDMPSKYYRDLYAMARRHGIQVPLFFSGMHHGFDPAGHNPFNDATRTSPWYTTEFWSSRTWYHGYGAMSKPQQRQLNRGIWKIIAFGGSGYNFYMLVGSTNFWLWNDDELAACYDYSSAIGQAGDLRPIYYNMKRANYFARSFADILENSTNADAHFRNFATGVRVLARTGPAGAIVFLDNATSSPAIATLNNGLHLRLKARAIRPVVLNTPLSPTWTLVSGYSRIFGVQRQGHLTTVVIYGTPKQRADVVFAASRMPKITGPMQKLPLRHSKGNVFATYARFPTGDKPRVATAQIGRRVLRVLIENRTQQKRTWFIRTAGGPCVVIGPAYAGALTEVGGKLTLHTSTPLGQPPASALVYSTAAAPQVLLAPTVVAAGSAAADAPAISTWQYQTLDAPANPAFDASHWQHSQSPQPMGADGILAPWCWYRATITSPKARQVTLHFDHVSNLASVFANGHWVATLTAAANLSVQLQAGRNVLAIFTAEHGRTKLYAYHGTLLPALAKGLWGHVTIMSGPVQKLALRQWQVKSMPKSFAADVAAIQRGYQAGDGWTSIASGTDYFHGRTGYAWYHRALPNIKMPTAAILAFSHVDDEGTVFLNGHQLLTHRGWDQPFTVKLTRYLNTNGKNQLDVLVHNDSGGGGITGDVSLKLFKASDIMPIRDWYMHDGAAERAAKAWQALAPKPALAVGIPRLYKAHFNWQPEPGMHLVLRASYNGLSSGHIRINGHDLGLYPDNTMPMGLYIPSVWLKVGRNTLEILDERGQSPQQAGLVVEAAASRRQTVLVEK
ncbi:MAG: hypothetical protein HKL96_11620 [Phycisphaerales bacterium]|nr:hypothetical protein [Phycisphaerales bacterium]